jgi:hypothetical protein
MLCRNSSMSAAVQGTHVLTPAEPVIRQ